MKEISLHGQPVNVGDKVWHILWGICEVNKIIGAPGPQLVIKDFNASTHQIFAYELFWQPIDPAAIEAAKVKPKEPEYSYYWYSDKTDKISQYRYTDAEAESTFMIQAGWVRVEESKREVKA